MASSFLKRNRKIRASPAKNPECTRPASKGRVLYLRRARSPEDRPRNSKQKTKKAPIMTSHICYHTRSSKSTNSIYKPAADIPNGRPCRPILLRAQKRGCCTVAPKATGFDTSDKAICSRVVESEACTARAGKPSQPLGYSPVSLLADITKRRHQFCRCRCFTPDIET